MKYIIHKKKLQIRQQEYLLNKIHRLPYQKEQWWGDYQVCVFNQDSPDIDPALQKAITIISQMVNVEQNFNTIVIKKIQKGEKIIPHVDSRNTVGKSISILLGSFEDARYRMDDTVEEVNPGDIIIQDCTNGYAMGPNYLMYPLQGGTQYAITICTILKENPV